MRTHEFRENTILVVDDEAAGRDLMSTLLTTQGYKVKTASDGFVALELVDAGGIDLVLLDRLGNVERIVTDSGYRLGHEIESLREDKGKVQ